MVWRARYGRVDPTEKERLLKLGEERRRRQAMAKQILAERVALKSIRSPTRLPKLLGDESAMRLLEKTKMANVYIEPRPKGRPEGDPIDDYVVEDHADHVLATLKTQREAIEWAKKNGHTAHVARVWHLNDKKKADHWRAA